MDELNDTSDQVAPASKRSLRVALAAAERAAIVEALELHDFNITRSARFLGVCRRTLQTKVHRLGLRAVRPSLQ